MRHWLLAALLAVPSAANSESQPVKLVRVIDGDSLVVTAADAKTVLRLADVDAPEHDQPYGKTAKLALVKMAIVQDLSADLMSLDRYGRRLARLTNSQGDINGQLVSAGLAWCYPEKKPKQWCAPLQLAAKSARRGLWAAPDPVSPGAWRKTHPR